MTVLCCPASSPHPDALAALEKHAPAAELADVSGDDFGYWREIRARWQGTDDLIIIEQDIEIGPDTVRSLEGCPEDWCCFAYPIFQTKVRLKNGLGCTKFSAKAQQAVTARKIAEGFALCATCKGQGCWWHLDGRISSLLKREGLQPHVHGNVTHLHDYGTFVPPPAGRNIEEFCGEDLGAPAQQVIWPYPLEHITSARQALSVAHALADLAEQYQPAPVIQQDDQQAGYRQRLELTQYTLAGPYQTDKVTQGYLPSYRKIAEQLGPSARVCEIGVLNGGSLSTWQALFPQGTVAGVDINPDMIWPDGAIRIVTGQDDPELPDQLCQHEFEWDLIVDDASHDGKLTAITFDLLWPLVSPGGFYVIEDWFTGFTSDTRFDSSMLTFAQSLLERLTWDSDTETIDYRYGMAILRKRA